ncbi:choline dehydrogenase-like flavoprotein [Paenibacillus sp. V4I3]|uniref:GMC oxidoreductase n=1 Tax=Paenibacillus sp. V4I3 TaxID=3042305 RepID=UPI002783F3E9|nr:GMC oxidoreductase [Paenibacillus sp. V4I3]MDQ0877362.1 choline dehydrogenase-like flavoprotein [Paenibacillus sp. V4I3]
MPLYIYVTEHGDTLRKIADKYNCELENLLSLNPYISNLDLDLSADVQIKLPLLHVRRINDAAVSCPPEPSGTPLDQWIPLTSIEQMVQTDYDVLIIGSGAGGGAALWRLCEQWGQNGKKIGMIEAGDLQLPTHAFNLPTLDEQRALEYWERIAERPGKRWPDYPGTKMVKALGGRTLLWYLFSPRFNPSAFRSWPITYKDLIPYYQISERIMNISSNYTKGSSLQEMLLDRLLMGGFPEATDIRMAADLIGTKYGQVHSNVFFSSIIFLAYALNIRKFDLAVNTRAIQILTENGKAAGVKVMTSDKRSYTLKARKIIVSASTWETPRLLLNSNIPNEAIGRYIVHHPEYVANGFLNRDQFPEVLGVATIVVPGSSERNYQLIGFSDFFYHYTERPLLKTARIVVKNYGIVEPRFENHVSLDPLERDAYGVPLLNIQFSHSDKDRALLHEMYDSLLAFSATMGLSLESPPLMSPTGYDNHECGTCRMGDDPATSVTNRFGQVHGISGLYIADNSVVNLSSPANPTLTTIALAMRTADYIIEQMK